MTGFLKDDYRRIDLGINIRIVLEGIEENINLTSYGGCVFEGLLRLREGSGDGVVHQMRDKCYVGSAEDFRVVMKCLMGRINEYESGGEKVMVRSFGDLNRFSLVNGSVKELKAPGIYKTGEDDSEAFKKLFE